MKTIDIVVPAYNEEACIRRFHARLSAVLADLPYRARIVFVDDGSEDATADVCEALAREDPRVGLLRLSRNFGHQAALTAGLDHTGADAVITMDADLQHPPEALPAFLRAWEDGAELVTGVRVLSAQQGIFKRATSALFYRAINAMSPVRVTENAPDFRLLDRKVVKALRGLREQSRFLRGMYAWVGFRQVQVRYDEQARAAGESHYRNRDMFLFALSAVLSFSRTPLRMATLFGLLVSCLAFAFGVYALVQNLVFHEVIRGWTSLAVLLSFLSGVQLLTLGVLGEYLGQVLDETKRRPLYLVSDAQLPELTGTKDRRAFSPVEGDTDA